MPRSGILNFLAGFVALLVAAFFAFLVALFVVFFLSLLVALGVPFRISAIIGIARSRSRGWWCDVIGIGRWIVTGSENAARRIIISKGPRKIKGSGKEERIENYAGSQYTKECGPEKTCGEDGSDENDSVRKAGSNENNSVSKAGSNENDSVSKAGSSESNSPRKTGSDDNSSVGKTWSNDNSSAGKTAPYGNGSASRPGKSRTRDSDQCDQRNYSDGFHSPSHQGNSGLIPARPALSGIHHILGAKARERCEG